MSDPIRIRSGSGWKHWLEAGWMVLAHQLASRPDPFGQNLTQSARTKPDPGWFCTVLSGTSVEVWNWVWKWETGSGPVVSCRKPGQMIPAHQLPDQMCLAKPWPGHPDQIRVGFAQCDPCLLWKTELKWMREVRSGVYYQAQFWLYAAHNRP